MDHQPHRPGRLIACAAAIAAVVSIPVMLAIERSPMLQMAMLALWTLCGG